MNLKVINAKTDHFESIREIAKKSLTNYCSDLITVDDVERHLNMKLTDEYLQVCLADDTCSLTALLDDDRPVGFCMLKLKADDIRIGLIEMIHVLKDYRDHKSVFKLFQGTIKPRIDSGMTEVEINIPECARHWIEMFTKIGIEFEPWRKFDDKIGRVEVSFWPGLLVIVPNI